MTALNELQNFTYISKYARHLKEEKRRESWKESVERVKNMMLEKYKDFPNVFEDIEWAYDLVFKKRVLGSQRTLQFGGPPVIKHNARAYNCCASYIDRLRFFQECMYLLLCGTGTGFSVQKEHISKLPKLIKSKTDDIKYHTIDDSIEGWSDAIGILVSSYFLQEELYPDFTGKNIKFNFSKIRPEGSYLSSSSGKSPGPEPLKALNKIKLVLDQCIDNQKFRPIDAYDIVMHSSDAVLSGGVRRSATICLFSPDDEEMMTAKTGNWFEENPQRGRSNNSVVLLKDKVGFEDFQKIIQNTKEFGEPGFAFVSSKEQINNPCFEISFYCYNSEKKSGWQFCNLSTINCGKIKTKDDFLESCKAAAIIGTLQAGFTDFPYLGSISEEITRKEALLGVSMTGIMEKHEICLNYDIQKEGAEVVKKTNKEIAKKININPAARTTAVKPEGCQTKDSLLITEQGILSLEEIGNINGDIWQENKKNILTDEGYKLSSRFFINGKKSIKIITLDSGITLKCTNNHQYRIIKNKEYIWERADHLKVEDILPYNLGNYINDKYQKLNSVQINKSKYSHQQNTIEQPNILDEDLAWLIGIYFGDGSNHNRSIRIYGNKSERKGFQKIKNILKQKFKIKPKYIESDKISKRCYLSINSIELLQFLEKNNLLKEKSRNINIPQIIRTSPPSVISNFIDGFAIADGCVKSKRGRSFCTTSEIFANQLIICLRAIGIDCKLRKMPPTNTSLGNNMRYWIQERKGRSGNISLSGYRRKYYPILDKLKLSNFSVDKIIKIEDGEDDTFDIEVKDNHTYISNSYISHNTTSCLLGTSSGIHPHHAKRYIRRVQVNKIEVPYQYFRVFNTHACEKSVWSANDTDEVISFPIEVEEGSKLKNQISALELLEIVKNTQINWVHNGRNPELCTAPWLQNNVSNTITVKENEWEDVTKYIYDNKEYFCGISLLPESGDKDYSQAPFTTVHTANEIVKEYGEASLWCSGLIELCLQSFDDLWIACSKILDDKFKEKLEINKTRKELKLAADQIECWERSRNFADKYFEGNYKRFTYCLKDVYLWKDYCDLERNFQHIDYSQMIEEEDNTKFEQEVSCAGGKCELV